MDGSALATRVIHWLASAAFDGAAFAALVWLVSVSLLRSSSGRFMAWVWAAALASFLFARPIEMHAVPIRAGAARALEAGVPSQRAAWLAALYVSIVALLLLRLGVKQLRLRRQLARLPPACPSIQECVREAARALGYAALPAVRISDLSIVPFSVGPLRPVVVLPRWLSIPGPRLHAVLLHELAHLQRRDHIWLWLERGVTAIFFFWPPIHWVSAELDEARERACDEHAIQRGALRAHDYARFLLEIGSAAARARSAHAGGLAIAGRSSRIERRIEPLIAEPARPARKLPLQFLALTLLAAGALISLRPAQAAPRAPVANSCNPDTPAPASPGPGCVVQSCGSIVCPP